MGLRTPLYDWHLGHKAKVVDFAGWDMPVVYSAIGEEHVATRTAAGLFDISHMGRLRISGAGAQRWLDHVLTNRVDNLKLGQVRYALVLNDAGCVLDDVLVTRLADDYLLVVNASNRAKLLPRFLATLPADVKIADETESTAMIACQGPKALELAQPLVSGVTLTDLKYYFAAPAQVLGHPGLASRTGYTGEDGVELIVPAAAAAQVWQRLVDAGAKPCGLGARDTLRLEAGMPLYGHELTEAIDPLQAGLAWAVKSADKDFVGKLALGQRDPQRRVRVGLKLADKRIPREHFPVVKDGAAIGEVASGTFGLTVQASIAMAYVDPKWAAEGTELAVEIRGQDAAAIVAPLPFYKRLNK